LKDGANALAEFYRCSPFDRKQTDNREMGPRESSGSPHQNTVLRNDRMRIANLSRRES
jgi:hypothetical protein